MTRIACVGLLALGVAVASAAHPFGGVLIVALALYATALWRFPAIALPAILALLPLLDFAQWTGWELLSEFDLALAVALGVHLLRSHEIGPRLPRSTQWLIGLVTASFVVSAVIGFLPLAPLDANALYAPYSRWSSLRQLKGFAWALAMLPLLIDESRNPSVLERRFTAGVVLGLAGTVAVILWQRMTFAGLFDFAQVYRAEGLFPELRAGGGDVHAYLVMALPFVLAWIADRPTSRRIALGTTLFVLATYAVGVTFTRGAYAGYAVAFLVLCLALARRRYGAEDTPLARGVIVTVAAGIGLAVLAPIVSGAFMEARLMGTRAEASTRAHHWAEVIEMMDGSLATRLFGMGLGTFPSAFLTRHPDAASATFAYRSDGGNGYLRLGSGRPLYLDQRVEVLPGRSYIVSLDMRSPEPNARLDAMLCEKSIQYSFRCRTATLHGRNPGGSWSRVEAELPSGDLGSGPWPLRRPVFLSLTHPGKASVVDVDNVRLLDNTGGNLLTNGDFARGGERWFSTADDHLPWHIFDLWVEILFEQGWIGVLTVGALLVFLFGREGSALWQGDLYAGVLVASLAGFLAVGVTESLFDGPRVTTLAFLICFVGLMRPATHVASADPPS